MTAVRLREGDVSDDRDFAENVLFRVALILSTVDHCDGKHGLLLHEVLDEHHDGHREHAVDLPSDPCELVCERIRRRVSSIAKKRYHRRGPDYADVFEEALVWPESSSSVSWNSKSTDFQSEKSGFDSLNSPAGIGERTKCKKSCPA